jgi:hypothetical protein
MPSLAEALHLDLSNYGSIPSNGSAPTNGSGPQVAASLPNYQPVLIGMTRSPLPILSNTSDNLRIFYQGIGTPQTRIVTPQRIK